MARLDNCVFRPTQREISLLRLCLVFFLGSWTMRNSGTVVLGEFMWGFFAEEFVLFFW